MQQAVRLQNAASLQPYERSLPPTSRPPAPPVRIATAKGGLKWRILTVPFDSLYKIERKLGKGGFGEVWLVKNRRSNQVLAVKTLHLKSADQAKLGRQLADTEYEISVLIRATGGTQGPCHRNVVCYYDHFVAKNANGPLERFIIMDFIPGKELYHVVLAMNRKKPSPQAAFSVVNSALQGLAFLHRQGVAHRDLKPENIILRAADSKTPEAVLIDLGIGCYNDQNCSSFAGSKGYMAPELFQRDMRRNVAQQIKSDIFSLGVVLREYLRGALYTPMYLEYAKRMTTHEQFYEKDPHLEAIVASMTTLDPLKRPSAEQLLQQLNVRRPKLKRTVRQQQLIQKKSAAVSWKHGSIPQQPQQPQQRARGGSSGYLSGLEIPKYPMQKK